MNENMNLKLKDDLDPSILEKYGFLPKYDEDTGKVIKYIRKIHISGKHPEEKHFTFIFDTRHIKESWFKRKIAFDAWMSGFDWGHFCEPEALELFFDLIKDGVIEPAERKLKK